ncbi:MAG TPA: hypothetical protein VGN17_28625 [Bryobacteraceae bacterium]|jgi:hypothetical protein
MNHENEMSELELNNLTQMEKDITDEDLFSQNPFPEPIDSDDAGDGKDVEVVSGPPAAEKPRTYGPFEVTEIRDQKDNALNRPQKSIRASFISGTKRTPYLISCFDAKVHALDGVELGGQYNFRGVVKRKITLVNGEKRVSFYLNIV